MENFEIGDKVRSKKDHNLIGTISEIEYSVDYWYGDIEKQVIIVMVMSEEGYMKYETFKACDIEKIDEERDTKEMTSYKVGDIVYNSLFNECMIIDISKLKIGYVEVVILTGIYRGQTTTLSIDYIKPDDGKFVISIDDYNEMANTIENLKKEKAEIQEKLYNAYFDNRNNNLRDEIEKLREENYTLKDQIVSSKIRKDINANALYYFGYQLPEVKSVLYHKPATIIFWKDGTKTVVKAQKKEKYDNEKGFVMAYLKKILGNEGNYYEKIKRWTDIR